MRCLCLERLTIVDTAPKRHRKYNDFLLNGKRNDKKIRSWTQRKFKCASSA
nr:MAG TPA: hypothetical protein [Bacteriophage sp.]